MDTLTKKKKSRSASVRTRSVRKPKTLEAFLRWEQPEGPYKYEWVDGTLEKTEYMMKNTERAIFDRMSRRFVQSSSYAEGGNLFPETPVPVSQDRARIPDVSFFTKEQIAASERGEQPIPSFVVEIISPNEKGFKIEQKALDYFNAGVQVLWQIYSNVRMVKVFTSPDDVQICFAQKVCSAAPAIPDLQLTVDELFGEEVPDKKQQ
jgi:Uma2 family endonuclease